MTTRPFISKKNWNPNPYETQNTEGGRDAPPPRSLDALTWAGPNRVGVDCELVKLVNLNEKGTFFTKFFQVRHIKFSTRAKIGICAKIEKLPHLPISTILLHHQLNFTATSILTFHISAFIANECININFKSFEVITKLEPNTRWH